MILVAGLLNIETTLQIDGFPLPYFPVRYPFFGVRSTVSGVGYNVAKALHTLGHEARLLSLLGCDLNAQVIRQEMHTNGISDEYTLARLEQTPQSVILYDGSGQRQIHVDLKNIQETAYPEAEFDALLPHCSLAALCNINFARPLLHKARQAGKLIATDVHAISDLDDPYNADFMRAADILFMSHERLPAAPEDWARQVQERYGTEIIVIGLGAEGALLAVKRDRSMQRFAARRLRAVVNTIGAGDALFSAFIHGYSTHKAPYEALRQAMLFAAWKIGANGAAEGFLSAEELRQRMREAEA